MERFTLCLTAIFLGLLTSVSAGAVTPTLTKISLVNASAGTFIPGYDPIPNNTTWNLSQLPSGFLVRATPGTGVYQVGFLLDGKLTLANSAPFDLCGSNLACSSLKVTGAHKLTVFPAAKGLQIGPAITISFVVTANSATMLSAPQAITQSGSYRLSSNIAAGDWQAALFIHDVSNVNVDCGGYSLSSTNWPALYISNVTQLTLINCTVLTGYMTVLQANALNTATFFNDTFGASTSASPLTLSLSNSSYFTLHDNVIYGAFQANQSPHLLIDSNSFISALVTPGSIYSAMILSKFGSYNTFSNNRISGNTSLALYDSVGPDDGILIQDETNDSISGNTIYGAWDCGVELMGAINYLNVSSNTITQTGIYGIGGWYWLSLRNSKFMNNAVSGTSSMSLFTRIYGLRAAGYDGNPNTPAETAIYFQNNQFQGNSFTSPGGNTPQTINAAYFNYAGIDLNTTDLSNLGISASQVVIGNNLFTSNNFGKINLAPTFSDNGSAIPSGRIIDGGKNVCQAPTGPYPLFCN